VRETERARARSIACEHGHIAARVLQIGTWDNKPQGVVKLGAVRKAGGPSSYLTFRGEVGGECHACVVVDAQVAPLPTPSAATQPPLCPCRRRRPVRPMHVCARTPFPTAHAPPPLLPQSTARSTPTESQSCGKPSREARPRRRLQRVRRPRLAPQTPIGRDSEHPRVSLLLLPLLRHCRHWVVVRARRCRSW
jgi:hypothetical protein